MSGACVSRARFAAALGSPMPTKHTLPFRSHLAAAIVIISPGEYSNSAMVAHLRLRLAAAAVLGEIRGAHHVPLHPRPKGFALPGNSIPRHAKNVVALVISVRVRRMRPARHHANASHHPRRQHA